IGRYTRRLTTELVTLPAGVLPFDEAIVFRYEEVRGNEPHQQSAGYLIFGSEGTSSFRVEVGGLARHFEADPGYYENILRSMEIVPESDR
ncbi:hypothetical protein JYT20_01820, partial [Rhodothermus sp. AH-315-K08]|nr:hypothetical protein [Rhodothermus sp. AH-315-K08]